jgi:hypothetical protein
VLVERPFVLFSSSLFASFFPLAAMEGRKRGKREEKKGLTRTHREHLSGSPQLPPTSCKREDPREKEER